MSIVTFLNFRIEAYSATAGSWMARELTEGRGDLLTPLAPLPLPVIGPLIVLFPLPPCEKKRNMHKCLCSNYKFMNRKTEYLIQSTLKKKGGGVAIIKSNQLKKAIYRHTKKAVHTQMYKIHTLSTAAGLKFCLYYFSFF